MGDLLAHPDGRGGGAPLQGPLRHAQQGTLCCSIFYVAFFLALPLFLAAAFDVAFFLASASLWCCLFFWQESPLDTQFFPADSPGVAALTAFKRRGNNSKELTGFYLKAKARIWPGLSYMCHVHSTADGACRVAMLTGVSPGLFHRKCL